PIQTMKNYLLIITVLLLPVLAKAQTPANAADQTAGKPAVVETAPSFPDGTQGWIHFLRDNVRYPKVARENGIQGKVVLDFFVEEDGSLSNVNVLSSPSDDLSKECLRVMTLSPKWKPGIRDGNPVRVKYTTPINFTLSATT